jgi:phosphoenolpyruvate synthase/pyruvate phosphate dikinase
VRVIEAQTGKKFGDKKNPLLFSVRSGAPFSMPGMMDTVLNLGLNEEVVEGLASNPERRRFVYDSYRRLIQMGRASRRSSRKGGKRRGRRATSTWGRRSSRKSPLNSRR